MLTCSDCQAEWKAERARKCADGQFRCKACSQKRKRLKYNRSERGKATQRRYLQSDEYKAAQRRYLRSDEGRATQRRYLQSDEGKAAKRRYVATEKGRLKVKGVANRHYWRDPAYHRMKAAARAHGVKPDLLIQVKERDKICQLCKTDQNLTFDHRHPVSRGGLGAIDNLQILCGPCNSFKGNRLFLPGGGMIVSL